MANFTLLYYVQPILPTIAERYRVSAGSSAQVLSMSTLAMAATLLVIGPLSDTVGRVALMRWSLLLAGLFGLGSAFAVSWPTLLMFRAVEGAALGVLPAVALAYLREEVHSSAHLRANATYIAGTAVGGTAARFLPGPMYELLGWTGTTVVFSAVTVAASLAVWAFLPTARNFTRTRLDLRQALDQTRRALRDPELVAWCVIGGCSMGAFVGVYNAMAFRIHAASFAVDSSTFVYLAFPVSIFAPGLARPLTGRAGRPVTVLAALCLFDFGIVITLGSSWAEIIGGLGLLTFAFFVVHSLATGGIVARAQTVGLGVAWGLEQLSHQLLRRRRCTRRLGHSALVDRGLAGRSGYDLRRHWGRRRHGRPEPVDRLHPTHVERDFVIAAYRHHRSTRRGSQATAEAAAEPVRHLTDWSDVVDEVTLWPEYAVQPLRHLPHTAARLNLGTLYYKNHSDSAASWAASRPSAPRTRSSPCCATPSAASRIPTQATALDAWSMSRGAGWPGSAKENGFVP
jgi:YNFM family putative membrane transporter